MMYSIQSSPSLRKFANIFFMYWHDPEFRGSGRGVYSCMFALFIGWVVSLDRLPHPLTRICLFNASFREKLLSQLGQGNGLTAKWIRLWRFRSWLRLKLWGHWSHLKGRSWLLTTIPPLPGRIIPLGREYWLFRMFGSVDACMEGGDANRQFDCWPPP